MSEAKTYAGSCHCGAVTFEAEADLSRVIACNCSICEAKGLTLTFTPQAKFHLSSGEAELTEYRFNKNQIAHQFCKICGVQTFAQATAPDGTPMAALNVRCLKEIDFASLAPAPVDGRSR